MLRRTNLECPDLSRITDPELLGAAIAGAKMSAFGFALDVLDIEPRKLNAWLAGDRPLPAAVRALCILVVERPALAHELARERQVR